MSSVYPPMVLMAECSCCGYKEELFKIKKGKLPTPDQIKQKTQEKLTPIQNKRGELEPPKTDDKDIIIQRKWIIGRSHTEKLKGNWYCSVDCRVKMEPNYWEARKEWSEDRD